MHHFVLPILIDLLSAKGFDEAQLFEGTGFESLDAAMQLSLSPIQFDNLCGNAVKVSQDPLLGLKAGAKLDMVSLGILGYALMSCASVNDSLRLLLRYSKMLLPSVQVSLFPNEKNLAIIAKAPELPPLLERFYVDSLFSGIIHNLRILTDQQVTNIVLELPYDPPENIHLYSDVFGEQLLFNASRYALMLDKPTLKMSLSSANPSAEDVFRRECDRLMVSDVNLGIVSEHVKQILLSARLDFPNCKTVSVRLHMSESTLQRRLAKEGTRYQIILDQVRYTLAREYLQQTLLPVGEIGFLLGYSNAANFRRSFKRWSGMSPAQLRT